jgi:hypothetical protein
MDHNQPTQTEIVDSAGQAAGTATQNAEGAQPAEGTAKRTQRETSAQKAARLVNEQVGTTGAGTEQPIGKPDGEEGAAKPIGKPDGEGDKEGAAAEGDQGAGDKDGEGKGDEADKGEEAEPELEFKLEELDPELAKSPALRKRWDEQQKGVQRLVNQAKEARDTARKDSEELGELMPRVERVLEWEEALINPETSEEAVDRLIAALAEERKVPISQLIGKLLERASNEAKEFEIDEKEIQDNYAKEGFDTPGEYRAYKRAKIEIAKEEREKQRQAQAATRTQSEAETKEQQRARFVKDVAPKVAQEVAKNYQGFAVTPEQVAEALEALPQFAKEPAKAVIHHFAEEFAVHAAERAKTPSAPPLVPSGNSKSAATPLPPPGKRKAADIMRANGQLNE